MKKSLLLLAFAFLFIGRVVEYKHLKFCQVPVTILTVFDKNNCKEKKFLFKDFIVFPLDEEVFYDGEIDEVLFPDGKKMKPVRFN